MCASGTQTSRECVLCACAYTGCIFRVYSKYIPCTKGAYTASLASPAQRIHIERMFMCECDTACGLQGGLRRPRRISNSLLKPTFACNRSSPLLQYPTPNTKLCKLNPKHQTLIAKPENPKSFIRRHHSTPAPAHPLCPPQIPSFTFAQPSPAASRSSDPCECECE